MTQNTHAVISELRRRSGLSQAELARRAGIPRSVMNVYERGHREPSAEMFMRIFGAAGFEVVANPIAPPTDPNRAGRILEQVIELAEQLPYRPSPTNNYPPLATMLA